MLKDFQDAEGHAVDDWRRARKTNGKEAVHVVLEKRNHFILAYSPEEYFWKFRSWPEHEKQAMGFVGGRRILDIGCGGGRHCIYLRKSGRDVIGIDRSPLLVEICERQYVKAVLMSINQIDARLGVFDTILMLGNNFGLFGNRQKAKRLLRKFNKITTAKARIITESTDPYSTADPYYQDREYAESNRNRSRMLGQFSIRVRYNKYNTGWFDYLYVSKKEMKGLLEGTGWKVSHFIDGKEDHKGQYIAIIDKKES